MSLFYRKQGHYLVIFGQTFPVKDQIKALGGRFDGATKSWRLPFDPDLMSKVEVLCRQRGGGRVDGNSQDHSQDTSIESLPHDLDFKLPGVKTELLSTDVISGADDSLEVMPKAIPLALEHSMLQHKREQNSKGLTLESALTVRELIDRAHHVVTSAFRDSFWIVGEIQNISAKQSAIFFDLAEARDQLQNSLMDHDQATDSIPERPKNSQRARAPKGSFPGATLTIRCVLWQDALRKIRQVRGDDAVEGALQDGLKVALQCRVQFYRDRAQLSLVVEDLDPTYTKGALALAREKLLRELRSKGLDRANAGLEFPIFPFVVGLISAEGSRAYSDFTHQLELLGFPGQVVFSPSPMQGDGVPSGVCAAIDHLVLHGCDVIVVTRGGGSAADLRWFDDRDIAFAIARCVVPVIAAIGHHDDRCVAEEVCYQRQKTPTAAADFLMSIFQNSRSRMDEAHQKLLRGLTRRRDGFIQETARVGEKIGRLATKSLEGRTQRLFEMKSLFERVMSKKVLENHMFTKQLEGKIAVCVERRISAEQTRLSKIQEQFVKSDPRPWLAQGWTQLQDESGRTFNSVLQAAKGQKIRARLVDGVVHLEVTHAESRRV